MKKIISFFVFIFIFLWNFSFSFAENWKNYLKKIDYIFEKKSEENYSKNILEKIEKLKKSGKIFSKTENYIIDYVYFKAKNNLNKINFEKRKKEIFEENISENDKKFVSEKIKKLGNIFFENIIKNYFETEKWDFLWSFSFNDEKKSLKWNLEIKDFSLKNNKKNFDFSWEISNNLKAEKNWKIFSDYSIKSFTEAKIIEKEFFIKIKNFVLKNDKNEKINNFFSKFEDISKNWNFVKINNFSDFDLENFEKYAEMFFSEKPLFKAYKKENEKYFLKPNKKICDIFKNKNCTKKDYENFLKDFSEKNEIFMVENGTKTSFFYNMIWEYSNLNWNFIFENNEIFEIKLSWDFPFSFDKKDFFTFSFKKFDFINFDLISEQSKIKINWKINENNKLFYLNSIFSSPFLNGKIIFENGFLNWDLKFEENFLQFFWEIKKDFLKLDFILNKEKNDFFKANLFFKKYDEKIKKQKIEKPDFIDFEDL